MSVLLDLDVLSVFVVMGWVVLFLGSVAVAWIPQFEVVAMHGKHDTNIHSLNHEKGRRRDAGLIERSKNARLHDRFVSWVENLKVPKSYFTYMYVWGLVWASAVGMLLGNNIVLFVCPDSASSYHTMTIPLYSAHVIPNERVLESVSALLGTFWIAHLIRRWLECIFITSYGASEMSLFGLLCGLVHYTLVPITFLTFASCEANLWSCTRSYGIFLFGNLMQNSYHFQFYRLKQRMLESRQLSFIDRSHYSVPRGGLFEYVCCPHYTSELIIYISFMCSITYDAISSHPIRFAGLFTMFIWVLSNLSVTAKRSLLYYKNSHPSSAIPNDWRCILPFVY
jgi:hypothetical protein